MGSAGDQSSFALFRTATYDADLTLLSSMLADRISSLPVADRQAAALDDVLLQVRSLEHRLKPAFAEYRSQLTGVLESIEQLCDRLEAALAKHPDHQDAYTMRSARLFFASLGMQIESGRIEEVRSPEDLTHLAASRFAFKERSASARLLSQIIDLLRTSQQVAALARQDLGELLDRASFLLSEAGRSEEPVDIVEDLEDDDLIAAKAGWRVDLGLDEDVDAELEDRYGEE